MPLTGIAPLDHRRYRAVVARITLASGVGLSASAAILSSCIARSEEPFRPMALDDAGGPQLIDAGASPDEPLTNLSPADPHAIISVDPPQGPFSGGRTVLVRGNGFASSVRIWFGDIEVATSDVTAIDANRVQVVTPPGPTGPVDVQAQNGDDESTRRTLVAGYVYDGFEVNPSSGPTSGGIVLTIRGQDTNWSAATEVLIDTEPCENVQVLDDDELTCTAPPGAPGARPIRIVTGDETLTVLDAFIYGDTLDGFRGGLSGEPLADALDVIALDSYTGNVIRGAVVVLDDDIANAKQTDASGVAHFVGAGLGPARTVTIAGNCLQPITLVDVRVDTLTAYLDPVLAPACGERGDLPAIGGSSGSNAARVSGELVWPATVEFKREGWTNVPPPSFEGDRRVAYLFRSTTSATAEFRLPDADEAITESASGVLGFAFDLDLAPGTYTLYALAGIENRDREPPTFTAYSLGVARGITARVGETSQEYYLKVDIPLDHAISLDVQGPTPTQRGPDRIVAGAVVRLADREHLVLPVGRRSVNLPATEPVRFVGLPPLVDALEGAAYVVSARAVTGQNGGDPSSTVGLFASSTESLAIDGFVEVPRLVAPVSGAEWDGQNLAVTWPPGGPSVSLTVVEAQSGGGLVNWTVVLPEGVTEATLPDLSTLDEDLALIRGPVTFVVSAAHIADFDYGSLRYGQLGTSGWDAYARDTFHVRY